MSFRASIVVIGAAASLLAVGFAAHASAAPSCIVGPKARCAKASLNWQVAVHGNLAGADFSGAQLKGADLRGANLRDANFSGATLDYADLTGANLAGANFAGASAPNAVLVGVALTKADLRNADFTNSSLYGSDLTGANLAGSNRPSPPPPFAPASKPPGSSLRNSDLWAKVSATASTLSIEEVALPDCLNG